MRVISTITGFLLTATIVAAQTPVTPPPATSFTVPTSELRGHDGIPPGTYHTDAPPAWDHLPRMPADASPPKIALPTAQTNGAGALGAASTAAATQSCAYYYLKSTTPVVGTPSGYPWYILYAGSLVGFCSSSGPTWYNPQWAYSPYWGFYYAAYVWFWIGNTLETGYIIYNVL